MDRCRERRPDGWIRKIEDGTWGRRRGRIWKKSKPKTNSTHYGTKCLSSLTSITIDTYQSWWVLWDHCDRGRGTAPKLRVEDWWNGGGLKGRNCRGCAGNVAELEGGGGSCWGRLLPLLLKLIKTASTFLLNHSASQRTKHFYQCLYLGKQWQVGCQGPLWPCYGRSIA